MMDLNEKINETIEQFLIGKLVTTNGNQIVVDEIEYTRYPSPLFSHSPGDTPSITITDTDGVRHTATITNIILNDEL